MAAIDERLAGEESTAERWARRWGALPIPEDPTADGPWMLALIAVVRPEL
jgi:hypothetical protein